MDSASRRDHSGCKMKRCDYDSVIAIYCERGDPCFIDEDVTLHTQREDTNMHHVIPTSQQ